MAKVTHTARGGMLLHGGLAREARRANQLNAMASIALFGVTDTHAIGRAVDLGRAASYRLVADLVRDGYVVQMSETGMPGSLIFPSSGVRKELTASSMNRIIDAPLPYIRSRVIARKAAHDMITQHLAIDVARSSESWVSMDHAYLSLEGAADTWLQGSQDGSWPKPSADDHVDHPIIVPDRLLRHLDICVASNLQNVKPLIPDALIIYPFSCGERPTMMAIEVQESNQGIKRDRARISTYARAINAGQIANVIFASSSREIVRQMEKIKKDIAAGEFLKTVYDPYSGKWCLTKETIDIEIASRIIVEPLNKLWRRYYFGQER
jgi:hypothetical protein